MHRPGSSIERRNSLRWKMDGTILAAGSLEYLLDLSNFNYLELTSGSTLLRPTIPSRNTHTPSHAGEEANELSHLSLHHLIAHRSPRGLSHPATLLFLSMPRTFPSCSLFSRTSEWLTPHSLLTVTASVLPVLIILF